MSPAEQQESVTAACAQTAAPHGTQFVEEARSMLLRDQVYQAIKDDILTGVYAPGQQVAVDQLAQTYRVSRTPVKEALRILQDEGLVEIKPRIGCFVSHVTVRDVQDIFEFRRILEGASAQLAAQRITQQELEDLQRMQEVSEASTGNERYDRHLRDNTEFHYRIALATRNQWLAEAVRRVMISVQRLVFTNVDLHDHADRLIEEHGQLLSALKSRDDVMARDSMVKAIQNAKALILEAVVHGAALSMELS